MNPTSGSWYVPGSVLNALWGRIMPRLAASIWSGDLTWPPETEADVLAGGLKAHPVEGEALELFAEQLVRIAFGTTDAYRKAAKSRNRLTSPQRATLVTTEYFLPGAAGEYLKNAPPLEHRIRLRVIQAEGYDFVLSSEGLDVFVPPTPGANGQGRVESRNQEQAARREVLQLYKFRETSKPPIGLPGPPVTAFDPPDDSFIAIRQLTAPTGAFQVPEGWIRGAANSVGWWLSGSLYRGIMSAFPRIVASKWYEEVAWDRGKEEGAALPGDESGQHTYHQRLGRMGGLKNLIEERVETVLPEQLGVHVGQRPVWLPRKNAGGWNDRDIMIASDGLYFPDPGPAPSWEELRKAIESGVAGNPVFTDSASPCA